MNPILESAKESVHKSKTAFCKFISANDAGLTGGHQEGFYIPKNSISLMFDTPGIKGTNKDRFISIKWQDSFVTDSRFIYYGQGTRNEYRLTRFGKGFPFLKDDNVGDLFILCHIEDDYYEGYVLDTDNDIEEFFLEFNISSIETNCLINKANLVSTEYKLLQCFMKYVESIKIDFPPSIDLAIHARECYMSSYRVSEMAVKMRPDENLLNWIGAEYELFKVFENDRYKELISTPFKTVYDFINTANSILNRRKSRAGKSLEHHLAEVFRISELKFDEQVITEQNKKPDFIFPDSISYNNNIFDTNKLVFLASKTTCKDRWRQILNEADRIDEKHLFTLQQGISSNQLKEMYKYNVKLVVPKPYLSSFPEEFRDRILTLNGFINMVKMKQN